MRRYTSNLAFSDMILNLLMGIIAMFVLAFLMINPVSNSGLVTPPNVFMIEIFWDDESLTDIDLYTRGPDGTLVYYSRKDGHYFSLERDDLGANSDTYKLNGEVIKIKRNYEVITFSELPPGEYIVNAHYFSVGGPPVEVKVKVTQITPFILIYQGDAVITPREETTLLSFLVDRDGRVSDKNTDLQYKFRVKGSGP